MRERNYTINKVVVQFEVILSDRKVVHTLMGIQNFCILTILLLHTKNEMKK